MEIISTLSCHHAISTSTEFCALITAAYISIQQETGQTRCYWLINKQFLDKEQVQLSIVEFINMGDVGLRFIIFCYIYPLSLHPRISFTYKIHRCTTDVKVIVWLHPNACRACKCQWMNPQQYSNRPAPNVKISIKSVLNWNLANAPLSTDFFC